MLSLVLLAFLSCDPNVDAVVTRGSFRSFNNYNGLAAQVGPSCGNQSFGNQSFGSVGYANNFNQRVVVVPARNSVFVRRGFRNGFRHGVVGFAHLR